MIARLLILLALPALLAGCQHDGVGSVMGGECKIFERPQYVVLGKRPYDQDWIDSQVEGGVGGCRWKRPAPRPPELDAPVKRTAIPVKPKRSFVKRIKDRILPPAAPAEPSWPPAAAPITQAPAEPPPPPRKPRSALEELLDPEVRR